MCSEQELCYGFEEERKIGSIQLHIVNHIHPLEPSLSTFVVLVQPKGSSMRAEWSERYKASVAEQQRTWASTTSVSITILTHLLFPSFGHISIVLYFPFPYYNVVEIIVRRENQSNVAWRYPTNKASTCMASCITS
jgi:hypothetical protein